jgi:hypothetical protein
MSAEPPGLPDKASGWLNAVKGLTITNAVVIVLLALVVIPGYFVWKALNDEKLLDRFLSQYEELGSQHSPCLLRFAQTRGGPKTWGISTGFAYAGSDRYLVAVWINHEPNTEQLVSYCKTLDLIVDFMRDPDGTSPPFPGTNRPVVRQYDRPG